MITFCVGLTLQPKHIVFFLEESKLEEIRKNILVSWQTENVTAKMPYKSITTQNQIDLY